MAKNMTFLDEFLATKKKKNLILNNYKKFKKFISWLKAKTIFLKNLISEKLFDFREEELS